MQPAARSVRARAYAPQETGILRPHESFPEAKSRRERESAQVEARVVEVEVRGERHTPGEVQLAHRK